MPIPFQTILSLVPNRRLLLLTTIIAATANVLPAQHHHIDGPALKPPKVFLDKSPRVVAYQLKRLDNQRLLMVQRQTDDKKFIPVYEAILSRTGMSPGNREEAVEALTVLTGSEPVTVLLGAIENFDAKDRDQRRAGKQLAGMLLRQPVEELSEQRGRFHEAAGSDNGLLQATGAAGLVMTGHANSLAGSPETARALLASIELIPSEEIRSSLHATVINLLGHSESTEQKIAAIKALRFIPDHQEQTFQRLAPLVAESKLRDTVVRTLLTIPAGQRDKDTSARLLDQLVKHAEQTPPDQRTSDSFIDAMQLADQLMTQVPAAKAKDYRSRLDAVTVRVVRIRTVDEEMRYDRPYFAVEAGKSVQIVLVNDDLMPHNLVITVPGALKEVAQAGLEVGPQGVDGGFPYVPKTNHVLHATNMVPAHGQERLTFTASSLPGEYPYVCTFPQHWYRMYGVMVVVDDLNEWTKNPVEPANPIGSNRSFVQAWTVDDFRGELAAGMKGRSPEIGKRLFAEASCAGCHKMQGEGGVIGPDLDDVFKRWKGDRVGVLREILDPSHKVDAKYAMQRVLTADGQIVNGILVAEDDDNITLMVSPDAKQPTVIAQDDIEQISSASTSIMPKALLDQYTKDEIFELMSYLESK